MFSPINVGGPDDRRKQLVAKLSQQARQNTGAHAAVPIPLGARSGSAASALGAGRNFGMNAHGLPSPQSTQGGNVLASLLARLGIGGRPQDNEVSSGYGSPITPYGPNYVPPPAPSSGIPIPSNGLITDPAQQGGGPQAPQAHTPQGGTGTPSIPGQPTSGGYAAPTQVGGLGFHPPQNALGNQISLGGGHFFDPSTGQIVFNPNALAGVGGASSMLFGR